MKKKGRCIFDIQEVSNFIGMILITEKKLSELFD
jgi:hypothetical protein